ncbi:DUF5131 family protein [Clostridium sp. PL3]|uniref:DUF5131 family protein n=2 Tax=Clostridium thailandense TaxID=2794346 RepID=A0A949TJ88_9CLOT|nr:DUF5131 family protein [Clostridium thailandense]
MVVNIVIFIKVIKLAIFKDLNIKHKCITAQLLLEKINIEKYLKDIELVIVGGESDKNARILDYAWVLDIRNQCVKANGIQIEYEIFRKKTIPTLVIQGTEDTLFPVEAGEDTARTIPIGNIITFYL